jgi:ribosomal 30S subunit maturation factor RimM
MLIPVIPEVVKGVNHDEGVIVITPMDGLLD